MSVYDSLIASESSLTYWWPLGDSGSSATEVKAGNTGTYQNTFTHGVTGLPGSSYPATSFNTGYVSTSRSFTSQPVVTVECWFKSATNNIGLLQCGATATGRAGTYSPDVFIGQGVDNFDVGIDNEVNFYIAQVSPTIISAPNVVLDNNWHHIVAVQNTNVNRLLYIDGLLAVSHTSSSAPQVFAGAFWRMGSVNSTLFRGTLAHCAVYSSVLSAATARNHYNAGLFGTSVLSVRDPQGTRIPGIN